MDAMAEVTRGSELARTRGGNLKSEDDRGRKAERRRAMTTLAAADDR